MNEKITFKREYISSKKLLDDNDNVSKIMNSGKKLDELTEEESDELFSMYIYSFLTANAGIGMVMATFIEELTGLNFNIKRDHENSEDTPIQLLAEYLIKNLRKKNIPDLIVIADHAIKESKRLDGK